MTVYETPQAARGAQMLDEGPDFEVLTDDGELRALFGGVTVSLFLSLIDSPPIGILTTPVEPDESEGEVESLLSFDGPADTFSETLQRDTDRAQAWAWRHGFGFTSDGPDKRRTDEHGVTLDVYVLAAD